MVEEAIHFALSIAETVNKILQLEKERLSVCPMASSFGIRMNIERSSDLDTPIKNSMN